VTDAELERWWPDLGVVVGELRRTNHPQVADALLDAVAAGASEHEILGGVGKVLREHQALRLALDEAASSAWGAVMVLVSRAFPGLASGKPVVWLAPKSDGEPGTPH
jgi:hypothetical protein